MGKEHDVCPTQIVGSAPNTNRYTELIPCVSSFPWQEEVPAFDRTH